MNVARANRPKMQFRLKAIFAATALAALACALGKHAWQVWRSLDPIAAVFIVVLAPAGICAVLLLGALPFAYRRAVRQIEGRQEI